MVPGPIFDGLEQREHLAFAEDPPQTKFTRLSGFISSLRNHLSNLSNWSDLTSASPNRYTAAVNATQKKPSKKKSSRAKKSRGQKVRKRQLHGAGSKMAQRARLVESVRELSEQDVPALLRLAMELEKRKPGEQLAFVVVPAKGRVKMAAARFAGVTGRHHTAVSKIPIEELSLIRDVFRRTAPDLRTDPDLDELVARNRNRVLAHRGSLLADALSTEEVGTALQLTRQAVAARVKRGDLLAIKNGRGFRFPRWQFADSESSGVLAGLPDVLRAAAHLSDIEIASWLSRSQLVFGGQVPADLIRAGDIERVVRAVSGVGVT